MELLSATLDFILPRYCPGCNKKLEINEKVVCPDCLGSINEIGNERLSKEYQRKFASEGIVSGFTSLYIFEKDKELQHIIHSLKYNKRFSVGVFLGRLLSVQLKNLVDDWQIDCIAPVPLHHLKKAERGYNQSKYIAKGLSKELSVPVKLKVLKRTRYTQTQTALNQKERQENIAEAFKAKHKNIIENKTFLLVDDVITTGATISECGRVLLNAGAKRIYACSVAVAE